MQNGSRHIIKRWVAEIDWPLLLFIIMAVNVKIYVKIAGLLFYFTYLFFYKKAKVEKHLPGFVKFYLAIAITGTVSSAVSGSFGISNYWFGFGWGILQWSCAAAICYSVFIGVRNISAERAEKTISTFFIANTAVCLISLLIISISIKNFPYWYFDAAGQYGVSAGDHIKNIFQGGSLTNAAISMLGALYFIDKKRLGLATLCMVTGSLSTSNLVLIFFLLMLAVLFFVSKEKALRIKVSLLFAITCIVYVVISPSNFMYIRSVAETIEEEEVEVASKSRKIYTVDLKDSVYQNLPWALASIKNAPPSKYPGVPFSIKTAKSVLNTWYVKPLRQTSIYNDQKPLKIYAIKQTLSFWTSGPKRFVLGAGIGNYSSKLAIKITALGFEGSYPERYYYAHKDFLQNTFHSLMYVYTMYPAKHSVINSPRNVYSQIAGEYGLVGTLLFIFIYLGYLYRNRRKIKNGGIVLAIFTLLLFGFEYWFEAMSLTVIFELLILKKIMHADS